MVFSSITFLYFFLPLLFLVYFIIPKKYRNFVIFIFSILFYIFGEKWYVILLLISCLFNYIIGRLIGNNKNKIYLIIGLIFNIGLLIYYKYTNFFISTFNDIFNLNLSTLNIVLPLGISFFTFQNISYLIDVYKKDVESEKNLLTYLTYITFFPQLVAGPIVRYKDVLNDLNNRKESISNFSLGVERFVIGLGKKVIIADTLYHFGTNVYSSNMSMLSYILVALSFLLQIYYDFSGYSDMAIGLAKMFGFNLKENFNYPLTSTSITEFWRRWHMSLSSFFKDYVYIPLGGSRVGNLKYIRNILVVWLLTGFWHGASYNFILWGLFFFIVLLIEKYILKKYLKNNIFSHIYTFILLLISFVIFNITDLNELLIFLKGMFGIGVKLVNKESLYYLKTNIVLIIISLIGSTTILKNLYQKLRKGKYNKVINILEIIYIPLILILSISILLSSSFNPFIYFRF